MLWETFLPPVPQATFSWLSRRLLQCTAAHEEVTHIPALLCLSTLCTQTLEGPRLWSSRIGAAESSVTARGDSCLLMLLWVLGQLDPGLHRVTDDLEVPGKTERTPV